MKNKIRVLIIDLFLMILIVPTIVWFCVKDDPNINYDLGENRELASFPESFTGNDYPAQIETWYNDNLPFRSVLNTTYSRITAALDSLFEDILYPETEIEIEEAPSEPPAPQEAPDYSYNQAPPAPQEPQGPHVHSYLESTRVDETCLEPGYSVFTCSCGDSFRLDRAALGHSYAIANQIPATCTEAGHIEYICTRCGDTYQEELPALGHDFEATQEGTASCIEDSVVTYTCRRCGYSYTEETKGLGHTWVEVESVAAGCETNGYVKYVCEICNETKEETLPPIGHDYQIVDHLDETCTADGYTTYRCSNCGDTYTDVLVHHHELEPVKTVPASVEDFGYTLNVCTRCGAEVRTDISPRLESNTKKALKYYNSITIEGRYGWLFYQAEDSELYYKGTNLLTEKQMQNNAKILSDLNEICKKTGKTLFVLIAPNKEQVYPEFYPSVPVANDPKRVERLVDYIQANTDVDIIYPIDELVEGKPYWQTYYKLDTHWNEAGAFIGIQLMYEKLGYETSDLYYLPVTSYDHGQGDLVNLGNLKGNPNYVHDVGYNVAYKEDVSVSSNEMFDGEVVQTTAANAEHDLKLVLVSDSYRKAMIPYLSKDFTSTTILHRSYLDENIIRQAIIESDVLVLAAVERYDTKLIESAEKIIDILSLTAK